MDGFTIREAVLEVIIVMGLDMWLSSAMRPPPDKDDIVDAEPRIHESVFLRMRNGATAYVPIGLPPSYSIVREDGSVVAPGQNPFETQQQGNKRFAAQQHVWNLVWWRRIAYFFTVVASLHLVAFPLFHQTVKAEEYTTSLRFVSETMRIVGVFLPSFVTTWWLDSFATNPKTFFWSVVVVVVLTFISLHLRGMINDRMQDAWRGVAFQPSSFGRLLDSSVFKLRGAWWYRGFIQTIKWRVAPLLSAIFLTYLGLSLGSHIAFYFEDAAGFTCKRSETVVSLQPHQIKELSERFSPDSLCWATGVQVEAGHRYVIKITKDGDWRDDDFATDLGGYDITGLPSFNLRTKMFLLTPLRRVLLRPWFRIIARVGENGTDEYFLDPDEPRAAVINELEVPFVPNRSGEVHLYVNDAVLGIPWPMLLPFAHNSGSAKVSIRQTR